MHSVVNGVSFSHIYAMWEKPLIQEKKPANPKKPRTKNLGLMVDLRDFICGQYLHVGTGV